MQHDMLIRKITRLAKHPNMGGYTNANNPVNPVIGVIGVQTINNQQWRNLS